MYADEFEKAVWSEIFDGAFKIFSTQLRSVNDWPRVKDAVAELVAKIIVNIFSSVKLIAIAELSGGEVVEDLEGGFDIDMLVEVESPAEAYALKSLEPVIDNALREALVYAKDWSFLKAMTEKYGKSVNHNIIELHVNDMYVEGLKNSRQTPPQTIYRANRECRGAV